MPAARSDSGNVGGAAFVAEASKFLGVPYVWGGESPKGFDCSGLVAYVAGKMGLSGVPRTSEEQWAYVQHIDAADLQPGDLVFYTFPGETPPGHVTIYAGNGQIIQAAHTGTNVEKGPMPAGAYGYGRIPGVGQAVLTSAGGGGSGSSGSSGSSGALSGWLDTVGQDLSTGLSGIPIVGGVFGLLKDASDIAQAIAGLTIPFVKMAEALDWFFVPSHWVRIGCGIGGTTLVVLGLVNLSGVTSDALSAVPGGAVAKPMTLPVGIAEVGLGSVLLFIALHNLDPSVKTFGGLLSYLQQAASAPSHAVDEETAAAAQGGQ